MRAVYILVFAYVHTHTLLFRVYYNAQFSQQHVVRVLCRVRTVCNPFKYACSLWVSVLFMIISIPDFMHPGHSVLAV
jgi:hypothetical protein